MKVIAAIKRNGSFASVLFRGKDAEEFEDTVSLSRVSGSCLFTLTKLSEHDGDSPKWEGPHIESTPTVGFGEDAVAAEAPEPGPMPEGPKSVVELPAYIKRVLTDVVGVVGKPPKVAEVHVIGDDGTMQPESDNFENLVQAIEAAVEAGQHRGIVLVW